MMGVMMVVMVISFNRHFESRKFKNAGLGDSRFHNFGSLVHESKETCECVIFSVAAE